jgi:hypothetical protein
MNETTETKNSPEDQKASNNSVPATVANHKHDEMQPIQGHCMKGGNIK